MKHNIAFGGGHFFTTANALQILLCLAPAISAPISSEKQFCLLNYQVHRRQQYGVLIPAIAVSPHQVLLLALGYFGSTRQDLQDDEFPHRDQ
jgi:hypothetical protein